MAVLDKKKSKVSDKVPSSSMADIAFLLLIFFLVTTTFPKNKGLAIVLPEEGGEVEVSPRNILHIIIQPNGLVDVKRGESQAVQTVAPNAIEGIWRQDVAENPQLIAAVKTDPQAAYRFMVDVLDALHSAGAERISLQLFEG
ncbi:MAG: biopolymer transporter ExbD [Gemmatimonadota bacterium]|jgi:biopolymer transport protein ExbD|uniref:Biopolymer transporter ExbD n=1 Tax=marine metagenome TaxID=408172 RepID=A0A381P777_9ZZZZ|nr:biopolymer transporter ExbD [Gemmatimonadota bacterium]MEC7847971.1 biopolymer transporter ExbD [Gemmatimonadota bacterium]MEC9241692.1 biopolymer transporter ExbD [Gemmatimonadota bacterium]MED5564030.1 biopolymer transporter ExbD [Gemmatimonadota bacterium]HAD75032.1 biopolymer transporter ExbD [Gemmatimonadota bacterium]|tara:strand:+ start:360 stop:785 length:426 start_codon:yes stop_codon:yes gene_type:complete